jgi:hypothetical protein
VVPVPPHQKKLGADTEMAMHSRAVLMIKTDFIIIKVALGAPAKVPWFFCLEMGVSRRRMIGAEVNMPLRFKKHTKHTPLRFCQLLRYLFDAGNMKKLLY